MTRRVAIVAVEPAAGRVAVPVAVPVLERRVEQPIAVVVDPVAELRRRGRASRVRVVAVVATASPVAASSRDVPVAVRVGPERGRIAVLVDALRVADLAGPRMSGRVRIVAVVATALDGGMAITVRVRRDVAERQAAASCFVADLRGKAGRLARDVRG